MQKDELKPLIDEILTSKKYRNVGLAETTVRDLLEQELPRHRSRKEALDEVRTKLHNIVAPYLGDPDYISAAGDLNRAFDSGDPQQVKTVCEQILSAHASTQERIPFLEEFYQQIFSRIGKPDILLDLACGLNPFAFPWMGLPTSTRYYAYDIHQSRLDLIAHYFKLQGLEPLAIWQDILVEPPVVEADAALFFKEAHRFEQRQRGSSARMLRAIKARYLLVSLPASSLSGKHNLIDRQRALIESIVAGENWSVKEIVIGNEAVFIIEK